MHICNNIDPLWCLLWQFTSHRKISTEWKFIWEFQDLTFFLTTPPAQYELLLNSDLRCTDSDEPKKICLVIQPLTWQLIAMVIGIAKLRKSATEKRNPKKHFSLSLAICDWKHVNRILQQKVGVEITNHEQSFGSKRLIKVERGQLSPEIDRNLSRNFGRERANACLKAKSCAVCFAVCFARTKQPVEWPLNK